MKWFTVTSVIWVLKGSLELPGRGKDRSRDTRLKAALVIPATDGCAVDRGGKSGGAGKCMDSE